MRQKSVPVKEPAAQVVKNIRRATRRHFSAEDKIRIVLEGLRGEDSIAELCRREGIVQNLYYRWSKEFLEAGKKGLVEQSPLSVRQTLAKLGIPGRPSTVGAISIKAAGRRPSKTARPARIVSGTASRTLSESASGGWPWTNRPSHP